MAADRAGSAKTLRTRETGRGVVGERLIARGEQEIEEVWIGQTIANRGPSCARIEADTRIFTSDCSCVQAIREKWVIGKKDI